MFIVKKSFVTLLEVIIAMALLSILLTSLFSMLAYTSAAQKMADSARDASFQELYVQHRLESVIPQIVGKNNEILTKPLLYIAQDGPFRGQSLVFVFDNDVGGDPDFSNEVLARLFVDRDGRFILMMWPTLERDASVSPPMQQEILLEGVKEIKFSFFRPPKEEGKDLVIKSSEEIGKWVSEWPIDQKSIDQGKKEEIELPSMIRIRLMMENDTEKEFGYVLIHSSQKVLYTK